MDFGLCFFESWVFGFLAANWDHAFGLFFCFGFLLWDCILGHVEMRLFVSFDPLPPFGTIENKSIYVSDVILWRRINLSGRKKKKPKWFGVNSFSYTWDSWMWLNSNSPFLALFDPFIHNIHTYHISTFPKNLQTEAKANIWIYHPIHAHNTRLGNLSQKTRTLKKKHTYDMHLSFHIFEP